MSIIDPLYPRAARDALMRFVRQLARHPRCADALRARGRAPPARSVDHGAMLIAEPYELYGIRPRAVILRFYSDGSFEEFWELKTGVLCMKVNWSRAPDRTVIDTIRLPPGLIPPLPEP
jgi:hypothetical protein